jgi:hypothetical protein
MTTPRPSPRTSPPAAPPGPSNNVRRLGAWLTRLSLLSVWAFTLGMAPIVAIVGAPLMAGLRIWAGDTEPNFDGLPFPWVWAGLCQGVGTVGLAGLFYEERPVWAAPALALGLGGAAFLELRHLLDLYAAAGGAPS